VALVARRPAVRVELSDESPYEQLLVSVRDAESSVAAIRAATGVYPRPVNNLDLHAARTAQ